MPKRAATNELNHNNWNQEEEPEEEECTAPKIASPEVMSKRIIKTGKRRITSSTNSPAGKSAFSNFAGFGNTSNTSGSDVKTTFSFLSNSNTSTFSNANGITSQKTESKDDMESNNSSKTTNRDSEYLSKLKGLNETVLEWIKIHVGRNPTCILTPIFSDYEKYLKEIQSERHSKEQEEKAESASTGTTSINTSSSSPSKQIFTYSFFPANTETGKDTLPETKINESSPSLSPGLNPLTNPLLSKGDNSKNIFAPTVSSSGLLGDKKTLAPLGYTPFPPPPNLVNWNNGEDNEKDNDVPPKNVFEPVMEEGAVFSKRIKLFLKKKGVFVDNGVGTLYIKPADEEGSKYQAIVRADTNLGNILLNIILKDSVPSKRVGKNNVMIVCILEVDKEFKSVPVLLRVKTEAEADNLLEQIDKYKKPNK